MKRWRKIILIVAIVLVALAVSVWATVAAVLASDWPRDQVVQFIEEFTELEVQIESLRIGTSGRTIAEGITFRMADEDQPILQAEQLELSHSTLLRILMDRAFVLRKVVVERPVLRLRQGDEGEWNLMQALEPLLALVTEDSGPMPALPVIEVNDGIVHVLLTDGRSTVLSPVSVRGEGEDPADYSFQFSASEPASIEGTLTLSEDWRHEVKFALRDGREKIQSLLPEAPEDLMLAGEWSGRLEGARVVGELTLAEGRAADFGLRGVVQVQADAELVRVRPQGQGVRITTPWELMKTVEVNAANVELRGSALSAEHVTIILPDLHQQMRLAGAYDLSSRAASLTGEVRGNDAERMLQHATQITAIATLGEGGQVKGQATLAGTGGIPAGRWEGLLNVKFDVKSPERAEVTAHAEQLRWTGSDDREISVADLGVRLQRDGDRVRLREFSLARQPDLRISGEYSVANQTWSLAASAQKIEVPGWKEGPVGGEVNAAGDFQSLGVQSLRLRSHGTEISGSGSLDPRRAEAIQANITASTRVAGDETAQQWKIGDAASQLIDAPYAAAVSVQGKLHGTIEPLSLTWDGLADLRELRVNGKTWEDLSLLLQANVDDRRASVRTQPFAILAGQASAEGSYTFADGSIAASLDARELSIANIIAVVDPSVPTTGRVTAKLNATLPNDNAEGLQIAGEWSAVDVTHESIAFQSMEGRVRTDGRRIVLDPIQVRQAEGRADGVVELDLAEGRVAKANLQLQNWLMEWEPAEVSLRIDGQAEVAVNLETQAFTGKVDASALSTLRGEEFGRLEVQGDATNERVTLRRLQVAALDGTLEGEGVIDLQDVQASRGLVRWKDLSPAAAQPWVKGLEEIEGAFSGELSWGPAMEERPLERTRWDMRWAPGSLRWRGIPIGELSALGYLGPERVLIQHSQFFLAEGRLELWASASRRKERWYGHANVSMDRLDLPTLVGPFRTGEDAKPLTGRLSGQMQLLSPLDAWDQPTGRGQLEISESDLANLNFVGVLFSTMGVKFAEAETKGEGFVRFGLEQGNLRIERFRYFNRGVDMYGQGEIRNLPGGTGAEISFVAAGVQRPLKDLGLPFTQTIDRVFSAAQSNLTTVRIGGTLSEPAVQLQPISSFGRDLRILLPGENGEEKK